MDIGSILPFLLQQRNSGQPDMTAMVNALTSARTGQAPVNDGGSAAAGTAPNLAGLLAELSGAQNQTAPVLNNPAALLSMLNRGSNSGDASSGGTNPNLNLVNLLSTLGTQKRAQKKPNGLKPVKAFIPDEILGKLVKYFNK